MCKETKQRSFLMNAFASLGAELTDNQVSQFLTYYQFLTEKNKVMNLTAITEYQDVVVKHFVDSAALMRRLDLLHSKNIILFENNRHNVCNTSVIDVGTGAGFPGVPLKILFPGIRLTLADSLKKRVFFLEELVEKCQLTQVKVVHGRAEDLAHQREYREQFDLCVSRAVAYLTTLGEYCLPFVKPGGYFISYKGGQIVQEVHQARKGIQLLGGHLQEDSLHSFFLPDTDMERTLVMIEKEKRTPGKYPRKAGIPSRQPLFADLPSAAVK